MSVPFSFLHNRYYAQGGGVNSEFGVNLACCGLLLLSEWGLLFSNLTDFLHCKVCSICFICMSLSCTCVCLAHFNFCQTCQLQTTDHAMYMAPQAALSNSLQHIQFKILQHQQPIEIVQIDNFVLASTYLMWYSCIHFIQLCLKFLGHCYNFCSQLLVSHG